MSIRPGKARRASSVAVIAAAAAMTLVGCGGGESPGTGTTASQEASQPGGGGGDAESGQDRNQLLAEVTGGDITLRITSAVREEGGFVTVAGSVTNNGSDVWVAPGWQGEEAELADNQASMAGAKLVDKAGRKRHYILRDTEGRCLCTKFTLGVKSGETANWYAQFPAPPQGNDEVDFQIADMPPAAVTLSEG